MPYKLSNCYTCVWKLGRNLKLVLLFLTGFHLISLPLNWTCCSFKAILTARERTAATELTAKVGSQWILSHQWTVAQVEEVIYQLWTSHWILKPVHTATWVAFVLDQILCTTKGCMVVCLFDQWNLVQYCILETMMYGLSLLPETGQCSVFFLST